MARTNLAGQMGRFLLFHIYIWKESLRKGRPIKKTWKAIGQIFYHIQSEPIWFFFFTAPWAIPGWADIRLFGVKWKHLLHREKPLCSLVFFLLLLCFSRVVCHNEQQADHGHTRLRSGWKRFRSELFKMGVQGFRLEISGLQLHFCKNTCRLKRITKGWNVTSSRISDTACKLIQSTRAADWQGVDQRWREQRDGRDRKKI